MKDITLNEKIYTHGGAENGFFIGTPCIFRPNGKLIPLETG